MKTRDFTGVGLTHNIASQALLAGLHEVLGPIVIKALGDALSPAQLGYAVFATQAIQYDAFSSALYCLRVLRLKSRMIFSDADGRPADFCILSTLQIRMNKNSLLNQN